ncbi:MAG: serine/threonine protein kinase/formylglycine-generating enzyme required for sulfatase activity [Myxococcota bacterium]|jgi:serine/threonine protein kinase/formylglycine-generating enzyme required for sulfatase activity
MRDAETLFAEYLDAGDGVQFDVWVKDHPDHEPDLRRLHADWRLRGGLRKKGVSFFKSGDHERPQPAPGLEAGKVIGDFRLVEMIGQGGMGQVWEAEQVSLRRRVAVKFVRPERVTEKQLDYFAREARAGGRLAHPGIVAVHGYGEDDGIAWIAMEMVEGCWTLRDFLDDLVREGEVADDYDEQVARFIARLAQALQAAHEAGVIHRDLKPQNILIAPDEKPKVTDFGLARITDESALSETGDFAGTYFYMSPEQVAAKRMGIDHRTDIFSLGVVMYEMLALRRPFQGDTTHQVAQQIVLREPQDMRVVRSKIPRDLAVICGKALEKDAARRYLSMAELEADIGRHLRNEPIRAKPPSGVEIVVKWTRRNPTKSVAGVLGFLLLAALALFGVWAQLQIRTIEQQAVNLTLSASSLSEANRYLEMKTEEAERKSRDVTRLSLGQDYRDLISNAGELWPAYPGKIETMTAWLTEARALIGQIPSLTKKRDELRALALPHSEEARRLLQESYPDTPEMHRLGLESNLRQHALTQRRDERAVAVDLPTIDWAAHPHDAASLAVWAQRNVEFEPTNTGAMSFAVVIAERAIELASDKERSGIAATLSKAYFALGRDDEALGMASMAVDEAREEERAGYETALVALMKAVQEKGSDQGLAAEVEVIERLEQQYSELELQVRERQDWTFSEDAGANTRTRWWHNQLSGLIVELESLSAAGVGLLTEDGVSEEHGWSVARRLGFARRMEAGFEGGGEYVVRWDAALPEIHTAYPGLNLTRQMGLVPMGADAESGLWEFWHVQTGTEPVRGGDGKLEMEDGTGLVFVLLRGGKYWMGAQSRDPEGRNHDPDAGSNEGPVHEVEVSAFFLSKYEMTQGQWERMAGRNPSRWTADTLPSWIEGSHPVERVSWIDCMRLLPALGLSLPTEAQWEYGCRAGTDTVRPFGFEDFATHANIADKRYNRAFTGPQTVEPWNDGIGAHGPVGRLLPNRFGLYDVIGNVWEWCMDGYEFDYYKTGPSTDPICPFEGSPTRVYRGSGFRDTAADARSANRDRRPPSDADNDLGVRPARAIMD